MKLLEIVVVVPLLQYYKQVLLIQNNTVVLQEKRSKSHLDHNFFLGHSEEKNENANQVRTDFDFIFLISCIMIGFHHCMIL